MPHANHQVAPIDERYNAQIFGVKAARRSGLGVSLLARVYPPEGRWTDRA